MHRSLFAITCIVIVSALLLFEFLYIIHDSIVPSAGKELGPVVQKHC